MKITHLKWRMQSHAQEQPLALAAVKSLYSTNGKEEEVNTGEVALSLISPHSNTVARAVQLLSSWMTEDVRTKNLVQKRNKNCSYLTENQLKVS